MNISFKKISKYFVRFIILFLMAYIAFSLYLQYLAQNHIKNFMSRSLNKEVQFSRIVYRFPLEFQVYDVTIDEFLKMEGMSVRFSKNFLVEKDINIARLLFVRPTLNLKDIPIIQNSPQTETSVEGKLQEAIQEIETVGAVSLQENTGSKGKDESPKYNVKVANMVISKGHLIYPYVFSGKEILLNIEELMIQGKKFSYPLVKERTHIKFYGKLAKFADSFPEGQVSGEGWVDIINRDMDGKLYLRNQEQGELLTAHIISKNNNVRVEGEINSRDLIKNNKPKENQGTVEDMAVKALSFLGVDIGIQFRFETKLNDFKISNVSFSGRVGKPSADLNQEQLQPQP